MAVVGCGCGSGSIAVVTIVMTMMIASTIRTSTSSSTCHRVIVVVMGIVGVVIVRLILIGSSIQWWLHVINRTLSGQ